MAQASRFAGPIDHAWLGKHTETIIEPDLPIVDPHHHLWEREGNTYLVPELLADLGSGHNIVGTVFEECHSMYRTEGPEEEASLGETAFVTALSRKGVCDRIVGRVDMMLGSRAAGLLERHVETSGGRFTAIRQSTAWDASDRVHKVVPTEAMLTDPIFRQGVACLAPLNIAFDAWVYHPQIPEVAALAAAFPDTQIVLNHVGSPILGGPYAAQRDGVFADWRASMADLARHTNVTVKLGALPIRLPGSTADRDMPPSSEEVATAWRPWLETCIERFGADRCMFESNFPVQKRWCSYAVVWNAFKRIAAAASASEKAALFAGTAARVYRLT
ncbi:MAG: amidohydrolase family protein [Rhodospirillales bacterium]